jgi:hypothetical protein
MRFQASLFKTVSASHTANSVLAVENIIGAAIFAQDSVGAGRRLMTAPGFLTTCAIADASQNWRPDDLNLDFTAAAGRRDSLIRHFATP